MKKKINRSRFLSWYFSDEDDYIKFAKDVVSNLEDANTVTVTAQSLLDQCGYIPAFIVIGEENDTQTEYEPNQCELID